jgi:Glycosyltransferases involved in cell wall biogenesis
MPLFSIVTVSYNCIETIEKTILSVIAQDCNDYEYIIIDGGSTDGTVDVIKKYQDKIAYWCSEKDSGIYNAMNKGVDRASGRWINFLNSGDVFADEQVLSIVKNEIATFPDVDVIYGNILIERNGQLVVKHAEDPCNKQRMYFCHQSSFAKAELLKQLKFNEKYKMSADFSFFKHLYYLSKIFHKIDRPLVIYDLRGISNTQRIAGLKENISVIKEKDRMPKKIIFLMRLYFVVYWNKLRKKS